MFVFLNMFAINQPEVMIANAHKHFDEQGRLTDETVRKLIQQQLQEVIRFTKQLSGASQAGQD